MSTQSVSTTERLSSLGGRVARRRLFAGLVVTLLGAAAFALLSFLEISASPGSAEHRTYRVTRGELVVSVVEQGTVESSNNTEIKCQVRGGYGGRGGNSTVTWVVPSGSIVQEGDELVRLDTQVIEETISLGKTDTNIAKAELARAQADAATAEVAVDAYLKGRFRAQQKALQKQLEVAKRNQRVAQTTLEQSQLLFAQGYVTELEVESSQYTVRQAELELKVKQTELDVLSRLTKAMQLETLNGQVIATQARLAGRQAGLDLEQGRLDLALEEFERCVIKAPKSGLVIYPSTAKWKNTPDVTEGASVHNNQVLLLMPDLSRMQVKIGVHESIVERIQPGMDVIVTLPDRTLRTEIFSVAAVASPAGWWTGNEVVYDAVVRLPVEGPKPGMSAEVEVIVARYDDVLAVPVEAVIDSEEGHFCWVETNGGVERRQLQLGDASDDYVLVKEGLNEGEEVILDPAQTLVDARELLQPTLVHTVSQGDLIVSLTEQGTLESSNNTKVKCRVRGSSTVNWVIESGTEVKAGDELVRLENKQIEDYLHERTKFAHLSRDAAVGFRAQANRAKIAISEYLEGRYRTELMNLEKDLAILQSDLRAAQNVLEHARRMAENGYLSQLEVDEKEFAVTRAELELGVRQNQIKVLQSFTKKEQLATLRGEWQAAKAAANGHEEVLAMDEQRIALAKQEMERCVIRAERDGLVIYPTSEGWKDAPDIAEGATVRNDQVLLLMPDLSQMQVKFGIHETAVERVRPGMPARVTLPGRELEGRVVSVASVAAPAGWWTGNIVKYDAVVELPSVPGLKPGMTAEVQVILSEHRDVLQVPVTSVVRTEAGSFCWVGTPEHAEQRAVQLGDSSDDAVVVSSGLREGETVIVNPSLELINADK